MGILSGLFKNKEKLNNNVEHTTPVVNIDEGNVGDAVLPVVIDENFADTDPNNVLEKMQQNFVSETERGAIEEANSANSSTIFNQKIELDQNNPMSIFGVDGEENKK